MQTGVRYLPPEVCPAKVKKAVTGAIHFTMTVPNRTDCSTARSKATLTASTSPQSLSATMSTHTLPPFELRVRCEELLLTSAAFSKFIDSHLKPFRCKIEACSKQEFSSTACLLRHEREAHGMHGHGDRPHLCYYPGCERGMLGNGFPRRYNLFDHMKRVHDHKEEPTQSFGASDVQGPRKVAGRKRKAPASGKEEPAAQRPKLQPVQQQPSPPLSLASTGLPTPYAECNTAVQSDRQQIYSQWANQRDLLKFQMSAVQSPDDEANLQRLSQNIEELRRLSQQARHG